MTKPILLSVAIASITTINLKADTLADWTFETSLPATAGPFSPEIGSGSASGSHVGVAAYSTPSGNGSAHSYSANTWVAGDYFQFSVPLDQIDNTYSSFAVTYDENGSATGPKTFYIAWSTDGSTFTKFGSDYALTAGITWAAATANQGTQLSDDFSAITALNTASVVYFRVIEDSVATGGAINGGNIGTSGTDRMDNFLISAVVTPVPEPASIVLAGFGGLACLFAVRRKS